MSSWGLVSFSGSPEATDNLEKRKMGMYREKRRGEEKSIEGVNWRRGGEGGIECGFCRVIA